MVEFGAEVGEDGVFIERESSSLENKVFEELLLYSLAKTMLKCSVL